MKTRSSLTLAVTAALGLGLTACGGDDGVAPQASVSATSTAESAPAAQSSNATSAPASSNTPASSVGDETGGTSASSAASSTTHSKASSTVASKSATTQPATSCAKMTGEQAAAQNIGKLAPPFPDMPDVKWQVDQFFGTGTYDACAPLSYIVVGVQGATASSPEHIMLFHDGVYLGTATKDPQGFVPKIRRLTDSSIAVTYTYPKDGEGNAGASGRAYSTFTWSDAKQRVIMVGSLPPSPAG